MEEEKQKIYLKGYMEGFESALKMAWSYAEELRIIVNNGEKPKVEAFIKKLTH